VTLLLTVLPSWIDVEAWDGFVEMRKQIKAPLTKRGAELIIRKLEALRGQGYDPTEVLDQSTELDWRGVWPIRGKEPKRETKVQAKYSANDLAAYEEMKKLFPNESWPV